MGKEERRKEMKEGKKKKNEGKKEAKERKKQTREGNMGEGRREEKRMYIDNL